MQTECIPVAPILTLHGALAATGTVHSGLLDDLLDEPYYRLAAPKSTGKELFNADYLDKALARFPDVSDIAVLATVTALTARTVADVIASAQEGKLTCATAGSASISRSTSRSPTGWPASRSR